ncbi:MAG: hypothetical protein H6Q86_3023 [candidate division NC10 bacterium]|jgi:hypothetical protein|nr:hypothetical protein [candidate division NC10 bacterium]
MNPRFRADLYRNNVLTFLIVLFLVATSACQSVKHVMVLRDAQESFSAASRELNDLTLEALTRNATASKADPSFLEVTNTKLVPLSNAAIHDLGARFADVSNRLAALNENERPALQQDKLYGTSMTLQLAAAWRAALLMQLAGDVAAPGSAGATGKLPEPPSFLDLRARVQAVKRTVEADKTPLFARDEMMLEAMEPMLAYDNAYVFGIRFAREGRFAGTVPIEQRIATVNSVVEPMAQAEADLQKLTLANQAPHLINYILVSRFIMLLTANKLVFVAQVDRDPDGKPLDEASAGARFPILVTRLKKMRNEFAPADSALAKALQQQVTQKQWQDYLDVQLGKFWK